MEKTQSLPAAVLQRSVGAEAELPAALAHTSTSSTHEKVELQDIYLERFNTLIERFLLPSQQFSALSSYTVNFPTLKAALSIIGVRMRGSVVKFRAGETILTSPRPVVFVISAKHRRRICEGCFKILSDSGRESILTCSKCGLVAFCSRECAKICEEAHSPECCVLRGAGDLRYFIDDRVRGGIQRRC